MSKKSILIDGHSLVYRMYYGVRMMNNSKGIPTNAIYGFVNVLLKIQENFKPDYLAVAFDLSTPTFRHQAYDAYKDGREKMPEDLQIQMPILRALLDAMEIPMLSLEGYEADDIIGTLSKKYSERGITTQILTGDRDAFQLVDDNVTILYTGGRGSTQFTVVDTAYIMEKYGVAPSVLIDVKALMGDASDNIPGVSGIGEKTALKLMKEYQTLDALYAHIDDLKGKQKERLIDGRESAYQSRFLGEICRNAPIDRDPESLSFTSVFTDKAIAMFRDLEFRSVLKKAEGDNMTDSPIESAFDLSRYHEISTTAELIAAMNHIAREMRVSLYGWHEDGRLWLSASSGGRSFYLEKPDMVKAFISELNAIPEADSLVVTGYDLKMLTHLFHQYCSEIVHYGNDVYLAAYLLSPTDQRYDLQTLAAKYLDEQIAGEEDVFGKGKSRIPAAELPKETMAQFVMTGGEAVRRLEPILKDALEENGMTALLQDIELPLLKVMASMEENGFKIDVEGLAELSKLFEERIAALTEEIYDLAGETFNINSTKQLGEILFDKLKLPVIKKTKTGYSTNAEVMEQLLLHHPIIQKILDYRMLSKLDSTYGRGLMKLIDPDTQKIYSTFNQTVTATGRLSSSDPNLQNIPVRTELGREIRRVFIPSSPENVLVDADYSQIELRVLAHLSGDENLIDAFVKNQDIHARTASEIFDIPLDQVSYEQRSHAKAINFGLIYGKQAFSLAKELGISRAEAKAYIDRYFDRYPKVRDYMEGIVVRAREEGFVTTLWGRRRYLPDIHSKNRMVAQAAERMALNTPIQGTAADIIKMAMIRVYDRLRAEKLRAELILQVHDELIIDAPATESEAVLNLITEEMEQAAALAVPLTVDAHIGHSWYEVK